MYSTAAIIALALSLSAPALAVPVSGSHPEHHGHHGHVHHQHAYPAHHHHHGAAHRPARELDLLTRELPFEARNIFTDRPLDKTQINLPPFTFSQQKREMVEGLFIRKPLAARDDDASGASIFSSLLSAIPKVVGGLFSGGSNDQQQQKQRRDLEDLLVREFVLAARDADESGASIFSTIIGAIPKAVSGISGLFDGGSSSQPQQQPQPLPQSTSQPLPQATTQAKREMIEDLIMRELFAPVARSLYELD